MPECIASDSVMITGANRGLGLEMIKQLLGLLKPPRVIIGACRDPVNALELQALAKEHDCIKVITLDVTDFDSLPSVVDLVGEIVGKNGLNLLINNAGIFKKKPQDMTHTTAEDLMEHYKVNVAGPYAIVKAFRPLLSQGAFHYSKDEVSVNKAAVINVSSNLGSTSNVNPNYATFPGYSYRTAKAALNMLTRLLSFDLEADRVLVVAVHPGWVQTDLGGPMAPMTKENSIRHLLSTIGSFTAEHNGTLVMFDGKILPW